MGENNIIRGKKWTEVRKLAEFEERTEDVKWIDSQPAIVADMKEYEDSLKEVPEEKPKSKGKK